MVEIRFKHLRNQMKNQLRNRAVISFVTTWVTLLWVMTNISSGQKENKRFSTLETIVFDNNSSTPSTSDSLDYNGTTTKIDPTSNQKSSEWNQWRGPFRDGHLHQDEKWPNDWKGLEKQWSIELNPGYSGPILSGDYVYTCESNKENEVVRCINRETGKMIWQQHWQGGMKVPDYAAANGDWIRSTPIVDSDSIYIGGMRDFLICLDKSDGKIRWQIDFAQIYKSTLPLFGMVSSPLIVDDYLMTYAGGGIVAINKKTGKIAWRTVIDSDRLEGGATSSMITTQINGQMVLIALYRKLFAGIAPDSGKILWKQEIPAYRGTTTITPVLLEKNRIFISMYSGRSMVFEITQENQKWKCQRQWDNNRLCYMSTPVLIKDHLFAHLQTNRLACLSAKDGKLRWLSDQTFGQYLSFVANQDQLIALDQKGILYLIRANPEKWELLDKKIVSDQETWSHLAVRGNELYIRDLKSLTKWKWEKK